MKAAVMSGFRLPVRNLFLILQQVIGHTRNTDGHGYQITVGAGHLFIMDFGTTTILWAGTGSLIHNGDQPGFPGEARRVITVGDLPLTPEYNYNNPNGNYIIPNERWVFVESQYMGNQNMNQHYAPRTEYEGYMRRSTVINKTYYDGDRHITYVVGPDRTEVEAATGRTIASAPVSESRTPGRVSENRGQISIYRPAIAKVTTANPNPAPNKVYQMKEVKAVSERKAVPANENQVRPIPAEEKKQQ